MSNPMHFEIDYFINENGSNCVLTLQVKDDLNSILLAKEFDSQNIKIDEEYDSGDSEVVIASLLSYSLDWLKENTDYNVALNQIIKINHYHEYECADELDDNDFEDKEPCTEIKTVIDILKSWYKKMPHLKSHKLDHSKDYYSEYSKLGGCLTISEFQEYLPAFVEIIVPAYSKGNLNLNLNKDEAYKMYINYLQIKGMTKKKAGIETKRIFKAIDAIHPLF
jgi:hypothetical protein